MHAGPDPYRQLEVIIMVGHAKGHFGVILATRTKDNKIVVDVQTTTMLPNIVCTFAEDNVRELM
jgi:hypothetical protein